MDFVGFPLWSSGFRFVNLNVLFVVNTRSFRCLEASLPWRIVVVEIHLLPLRRRHISKLLFLNILRLYLRLIIADLNFRLFCRVNWWLTLYTVNDVLDLLIIDIDHLLVV